MEEINLVWKYKDALVSGAFVTLHLNLVSISIGTAIGFLVAYMRMSSVFTLQIFARIYVDIFRAIPLLVLLIWLFFSLPMLPLKIGLPPYWAAVTALALNLSAFAAEIFRTGVGSIDKFHSTSARLLGATPFRIFKDITIPLAARYITPPTFGLYINQFKLSVLASIIAVPEILHTVSTISTLAFRPLEFYTTLALFFMVVVLVATTIQGSIENKINPKNNFQNKKTKEKISSEEGGVDFIRSSHAILEEMTVKELSVWREKRRVLEGISFELKKGQIKTIIGPNGSGKSTFLEALIQQLPYQGAVEYTISSDSDKRVPLIGYIAQNGEPWPHMTVFKNLENAIKMTRRFDDPKTIRKVACSWVNIFGLASYRDLYPASLSGGERQRLLLARTLCIEPDILILDEATSALDFRWTPRIAGILRKVSASGVSILAVSHSKLFIEELSDIVVYIEDGKILEEGSTSEILNVPKTEQLRNFLSV